MISDHIFRDISPRLKTWEHEKLPPLSKQSRRWAMKVEDRTWMQEVGRSVRSSSNPRVDWWESPWGCTCAITRRMHKVCDEHGQIWWVTSAQTRDAGTDSRQGARTAVDRTWGPSKSECMRHSCKQTVWGRHPQRVPGLFKFSSGANDIKVLVGIEKRCQQELLLLMAENGNTISQPNSWLLCSISGP